MPEKIAVLMGGSSAEREVSLRSGQAVLQALLDSGVDAIAFDPAEQVITNLVDMGIDKVLIMLHGRGGEDGAIQGALETLGIPYTGSGVLGSALCMDKVRSKQIFEALKLPTSPYYVVHKSRFAEHNLSEMLEHLGGTAMIKPSLEGSSVGMSKVSEVSELQSGLDMAFDYDDCVLVEKFVVGQEYTVSILGDLVLPSIRMETPRVFYDYQAKYHSDTTQYYCPSGLTVEKEQQIAQLSMEAFKALGASGWGRVDLMQDDAENFYLLEVNTIPGMTAKSLVPMAAKQAGMTFEQLVLAILSSG